MPTDAVPFAPFAANPHAHHWLIEPPTGPLSVGRCRECGSERSFSNGSPAAAWVRGPDVDSDVVQLRRDLARWRAEVQLSDEAA